MIPKRIQRKRVKGWRIPEGAVYVGRPTKWGNPYWPGSWNPVHVAQEGPVNSPAPGAHLWSAQEVVDAFSKFVAPYLDVEELRGKDLACWCLPDQPCHADVLLEVANGGETAA